MAAPLPPPLSWRDRARARTEALSPFGAVRRRFRAWWLKRLPNTDTLALTQRNVYILPTRAGLMFCVTLMVLLVASINYQLSLGYLLTFLLAGSGVVSMHITHSTLRGLTLHLRPPTPSFANTPALLDITLSSPGNARFGIGIKLEGRPADTLTWTDVPAGAQSHTQVTWVPAQRGRHAVPPVSVETRFPLGLFRAWAVWRPAAELLVYPSPEQPAAPLPPAHATAGGAAAQRRADGGEIEGIRSYRRGDPLKLVVWKKAARSLETGGELVSRDTTASVQHELWLDWQHCAGLAPEERLSRLTAWVLLADQHNADHGLRLPGWELPPSHGDGQRQRALEALALWH
ncbi:MAG: hypothetical protein RLZZ618_3578 [Pseudomonadota bacterium]|jgi:uncharacterized protein (DUF58 family)